MIIKGVDVLPHGLINNVAEKFGPSGEIFADYVRWLVGRIGDLAPSPGYRPRLHFDLYGCAGLAFDADADAVAEYLAELGEIAHPYDLAIEHPIDAGSRDAQIATYRTPPRRAESTRRPASASSSTSGATRSTTCARSSPRARPTSST